MFDAELRLDPTPIHALPSGHGNALIATSLAGTVCCAMLPRIDRVMTFKSDLFIMRPSRGSGDLGELG